MWIEMQNKSCPQAPLNKLAVFLVEFYLQLVVILVYFVYLKGTMHCFLASIE